MSVDQALLESVDDSQIPVLRFYQWSEPTLSLGYFQRLADRDNHVASRDAQCLRRSTGGGAIVHHHDLTYSLAVPMRPSASGARIELYRAVHDAFLSALCKISVRASAFRNDRRRGGQDESYLCFQRRSDEDLVVSGYKVLGSAQRRSRRAILQHGSLLLKSSTHAPELPGIHDLTSREITNSESIHTLIGHVIEKLESFLDCRFEVGELVAAEQIRARQISVEKFECPKWLHRR